MGNAPSTEAPRRSSQRLSKPKTGNHVTAGLLSPGSLTNVSSRRLSNAQLPNPPAPPAAAPPTPTSLSTAEAPSCLSRRVDSCASLQSAHGSQGNSKRRGLFRSMSTRRAADSVYQHPSATTASAIVDGPVRAGSSLTYEPAFVHYGQAAPDSSPVQLDRRASWNYNLGSYGAQRLLNVTGDPGLQQTATMSEDNGMTAVEETTWKTLDLTHLPSGGITRASSDVSLCMPVRRRSIIQTPGVATRANSARDLPSLPQTNVRHSHPPTPSLSRQQSVESYRSGILSMPPLVQDPESVQRVATPCEEQYQSIGAFKLGSLRITNGSPSPATPDVEPQGSRESEGLGSGSGAARGSYFLEKPAHGEAAMAAAAAAASKSSKQRPPEFLRDFTHSPALSPSKPSNPVLQTTSKATALEDKLFDDDAHPEYFSAEVLDVRLDPNAKPPHAQVERATGGAGVTRTDSGFVSVASPTFEVSHKTLTKADSGYSSNVSLRSFRAKNEAAEDQPGAVLLEKQSSRSSGRIGALARAEALAALSRPEVSDPHAQQTDPAPPPVPPKDPARTLPSGMVQKSISMHNLADSDKLNPASPARSGARSGAFSASGSGGPGSTESALCSPKSSRSPNFDSAASAPKPGRFQRLLSSARRSAVGPSTAHSTRTADQGSVPLVSQQVEHTFGQQPGRFPMAAKRLAVRHRSSMDTLKTIFSVGSMEVGSDAVSSLQSVPTVQETKTKGATRRHTLQTVPTSIASAAAHVIAKKPIMRKPVPARQASTSESKQGAAGSQANGAVPASPLDATAASHTPKSEVGGTLGLTTPSRESRHGTSSLVLAQTTAGLPSPPLPSPVAKAMSAESSTRLSQAVATPRRPLSLRVPPPLRPGSTVNSLHRKASREGIPNSGTTQTFPRRMSMDSVYSHTSSQPEPSRSPQGVSMDPRRLQSFRQYHNPRSPLQASPTWDARLDRGEAGQMSHAFGAGGSGSRRNSVSSVHSEGVVYPRGAYPWQGRSEPQPQPSLRHRASYDGFSFQQRPSRNVYPPSMSNGYTAPLATYSTRPAPAWSRSQSDPVEGQWYQHQRQHQYQYQYEYQYQYQPQHPSRHQYQYQYQYQDGRYYPSYAQPGQQHYRHRSTTGSRAGTHGLNPPYRVLHSYNSPAYRNAPIWG